MKLEPKTEEKPKDAQEPEKKPDDAQLPPEDAPETKPPETPEATPPDAKARDLEIENAVLKARLEERESLQKAKEQPKPAPVDPEYTEFLNTKTAVLNDARGLDDEAFQEKYRYSKAEAQNQIMAWETGYNTRKLNEDRAILRAEATVAKKYGEQYAKHEEAVSESIRDLSPAVKADPQRLAAHIERTLRGLIAEEPKPKAEPRPKPKEDDMGKRIVDTGFTPPKPKGDDDLKPKPTDDIAEPDRKLASMFGLKSESERKKLKETPFVEMNFGSGVFYGDKDKGFEKRTSK